MDDNRLVAHPGGGFAAPAVGPQDRHDQVGRDGMELLGALVARARDEGPLEARGAQDTHGLVRRHDVPGVVAVVDVRIDQRQVLGPRAGRNQQCQQRQDP